MQHRWVCGECGAIYNTTVHERCELCHPPPTTNLDFPQAWAAMRDGKTLGFYAGVAYRTNGTQLEVYGFLFSEGRRVWGSATAIKWEYVMRTDWRIVKEEKA